MICQVFLDSDNWTLVTTHRILSSSKGEVSYILATEIKTIDYGLFKNPQLDTFTKGKILDTYNQSISIFIETEKPAMVMVYAIDTLQQICS